MRGLKDMFDVLMNNYGYTKSDLKNMMNIYGAEGIDPIDMMKENITLEGYAPIVDSMGTDFELQQLINAQYDPDLIMDNLNSSLETSPEHLKDIVHNIHDNEILPGLIGDDVVDYDILEHLGDAKESSLIFDDPNQNIINRDMFMKKAGDIFSRNWFDEIQPALASDDDLATLYNYLINKKPY